jgi:DNA helicase II / ATP-dependent DNA helicase PcrA
MPSITWTDQQLAIFSHVESAKPSLNVKARAGTGKTTTGVEIARRGRGKVFYGAFNKSIADEICVKVASNPRVTGGTFHSIAYRLLREIRQRCRVDGRKVSTLARDRYPYDKKIREVLTDAVGFAKLDGLGLNGMPDYTDEDAWRELLETHDMMDEIPAGITDERFITDCIHVFKQSVAMFESTQDCVIDFNDMLYAPLYLGAWKPQRFDMVIVDEAQDTNETRLRIAQAILVDGGKMVAIGDPAQAIYQFAGATNGAMDIIKDRMHADELPLSLTYRCPKKIVEMVKSHVPDYEAAPANIDGTVTTIKAPEFWQMARTLKGADDVILCRVTRPLVGIAKQLRGEGIPCMVEGNSGKAIIALLEKWGVNMTWGQYLTRMEPYIAKACEAFRAKNKEEKAEYLEEKRAIIMDIADDPMPDTPLVQVIQRVERMFGDSTDPNVLRLCTIHRSKGREWKRVILVGRNRYMPSPWAKSEEDEQAEANVEYVAITRTKETLVEVEVISKKEEQEAGVDGWWEL